MPKRRLTLSDWSPILKALLYDDLQKLYKLYRPKTIIYEGPLMIHQKYINRLKDELKAIQSTKKRISELHNNLKDESEDDKRATLVAQINALQEKVDAEDAIRTKCNKMVDAYNMERNKRLNKWRKKNSLARKTRRSQRK